MTIICRNIEEHKLYEVESTQSGALGDQLSVLYIRPYKKNNKRQDDWRVVTGQELEELHPKLKVVFHDVQQSGT